jgi:hypothetical protein
MGALSREEQRLLRMLEQVHRGDSGMGMRFKLLRRGLVDTVDLRRLSDKGEALLRELRERDVATLDSTPAPGLRGCCEAAGMDRG